MFDEVICAGVRRADHPTVDCRALIKVAELLDSARGQRRTPGNENFIAAPKEIDCLSPRLPIEPSVRKRKSQRKSPARKPSEVRSAFARIARSRGSSKQRARRRKR
jgi:hypothetical protein